MITRTLKRHCPGPFPLRFRKHLDSHLMRIATPSIIGRDSQGEQAKAAGSRWNHSLRLPPLRDLRDFDHLQHVRLPCRTADRTRSDELVLSEPCRDVPRQRDPGIGHDRNEVRAAAPTAEIHVATGECAVDS